MERTKQQIRNHQKSAADDHFPDSKEHVFKMVENYQLHSYKIEPAFSYDVYRKTAVDIVFHQDSVYSRIKQIRNSNDFISKYLIHPFSFCFDYVKPNPESGMAAVTVLLYEDYNSYHTDKRQGKISTIAKSASDNGIFQILGHENILSFLNESFGNIDLFKDKSDVMLLSFKGPLSKKNSNIYTYKFVGNQQIGGEQCLEIFFYSKAMNEKAFAGYLYITAGENPKLVQADFMFNNPESTNFLNNVFITHKFSLKDSVMIPIGKESILQIGNENKGSIVARREELYLDYRFAPLSTKERREKRALAKHLEHEVSDWQKIRPIPLTESQTQVGSLRYAANQDKQFHRLENRILLALNGAYSFGGVEGKVETGPLTHFVSYNQMEGLRLRAGGNTTINLSNHLQLGGYAAYGTKDEKIKYQANLSYSLLAKNNYVWEYPKKLISFAYASDLNIPGQDLFQMNRDHFSQSFSHVPTNNMSHQQIALITFEKENNHNFSYKAGTKYTYDQPMGVVQYMQRKERSDTLVVNNITSSELQLSLRYAPGEKFIQRKEKRAAIRRAYFELDFTHKIGLKGVFNSDYNYHISTFNLFKRFSLDKNAGQVDIYLSGGKIWGQVPFPLLFIPEGNQSYIFNSRTYNCMNFYEFVTDRFLSTSINSSFNWSPMRLFMENDKMKVCLGARMIYGPLSPRNNPDLHPGLFVFNNGITPLGHVPYIEANIGIANIFKLVRVDYSRRLTYTSGNEGQITRGTILFSGSFSF